MYYPLSYKLNQQNVKQFIKASAPDAKDAATKFIKSTTHISFEKFIGHINANLKEVVNKYVSEDTHLYAYIDDLYYNYINKSNYWIFQYIRYLAKKKYNKDIDFINSLNNDIVQDGDIVLLIDDCVYSGNQMSDTISGMVNTEHKNLHLVLFIPFISEAGLEQIEQAMKDNAQIADCLFTIPKNIYTIKPLSTYMTANEFSLMLQYYLTQYYNLEATKKMNAIKSEAKYEIEKYPVYFDHKLADFVSSYPLIYSGLVPNEYNAEISKQIDDLTFQFKMQRMQKRDTSILTRKIAALEEQYVMYPLITHCEHLKKPEKNNSTCPSPPYKDGYNDFIKLVKQNMKSHGSVSRSRRSKDSRFSMTASKRSSVAKSNPFKQSTQAKSMTKSSILA